MNKGSNALWYISVVALFIFALMLSANLRANGNEKNSHSHSGLITSEQTLTNETVNQQTLVVEDGAVTSKSTGFGGDGYGGDARVSIEGAQVPRQAPSVFMGAPRSTAPMLKCIGIGASGASGGDAGGGAIGWCWVVRPLWWEDQANKLANMGFTDQAANAACMDKLQWKPFGSKDECIAAHTQLYIEQSIGGDTESLGKLSAPDELSYEAVVSGDLLIAEAAIDEAKIAALEAELTATKIETSQEVERLRQEVQRLKREHNNKEANAFMEWQQSLKQIELEDVKADG